MSRSETVRDMSRFISYLTNLYHNQLQVADAPSLKEMQLRCETV